MSESGPFYATFIDPLLARMRKRVALEVKNSKTVLDVACGTGAQIFEFAKVATTVTGIDLSASMIEYAKNTAIKNRVDNVDFHVCDATNLTFFNPNHFEIATMSLALHQFSPQLHLPILSEMKRVAQKIIIVDYAVPLPKNYVGLGSKFAEFLAGKEHNQNFESYYRLGGLPKILKANNLKIEKSVTMGKGAFQLVICSVPK